MHPIRTPASNFTYLGPAPHIGDLPCQRAPDGRGGTVVLSTWELTPDEREAIARGANIEVGIYAEPIPPISVAIAQPTQDDAAVARERRWKEETRPETPAPDDGLIAG